MKPDHLETIDERTPQECLAEGYERPRPLVVCLIVLSVGFFHHADKEVYEPTPEEKRLVDQLHLRKIDWADRVRCLNVLQPWCRDCAAWRLHGKPNGRCACGAPLVHRGYVGASTLREIDYTRRSRKDLFFDEPFWDPRLGDFVKC
jgi:hypothetical protein